MQISRLLATACLFTASLAGPVSSQEEVDIGPVGPSPYDVVRAWHKPFAKQGFAHETIRVSGLNHRTVSWLPSVERPSRLWCQNPESI